MRLIDVAMPRLGDDSDDQRVSRPSARTKPAFQPPVKLFGSEQEEYIVDDVSVKETSEDEAEPSTKMVGGNILRRKAKIERDFSFIPATRC